MKNLIVIGNGMVGHRFIEKVVGLDKERKYQIISFCEEPRVAYNRVYLSEYFTGKTAEELTLAPLQWYKEQGVDFYLNDAVISIDRQTKTVLSKNGLKIPYDKIILATGSTPFVPPVPGIDKEGVFTYRTIEDLEAITAYSKKCRVAAVIGGGLLGLEAAKSLTALNLETHVIEFTPKLMPRQIDQTASDFLQKKIEELGVKIHLSKNSKQIIGNGFVQGLSFADGSQLEVDMIVVSAGIRPRDELARKADITVGDRGGILVNDFMQTCDPNIYAIGECALHEHKIYGLVAPGYRMAETACHHLLELHHAGFKGADMSTKLKLMGVDVASIGNSLANGSGTDVVTLIDSRAGIYKKLILSNDDSNTLQGAILIGDTTEYGQLLQLYLNKISLPDSPETLIVKGGASQGGMGVDTLPDEAQICSCENITKGVILQNIDEGCQDIASLKQCTKAGTGCGSCVPLLKDLLELELEKAGVVIDKSLCEHFAYTRQELLALIKNYELKTYDELLARYGQGLGCEICKPTIASILASVWNGHVMDLQTIQETNDYYMANIQKNGTYSVIPRVAGGEITPEQLLAIGELAKEFKLYTKITGAQRIGLFGARLEELPKIWERLEQAGLESGQAYAKALRAVKSCVGSAWCRFGVQDSTSLAIEIENRYRGLRMPHKVKMAVSGCARECAEAQGKDVGIIATENGWNLYLCGNGGMKPQHALLFATDLDKERLIQYIDRFLMYYIRTADKLTRTSSWLNKLPGGIDSLKQVVIDDSLGIAEELEQEMHYIVDSYQCEWEKTLASPDKLRYFQPFVNSTEGDSTISFEINRGQLQPI